MRKMTKRERIFDTIFIFGVVSFVTFFSIIVIPSVLLLGLKLILWILGLDVTILDSLTDIVSSLYSEIVWNIRLSLLVGLVWIILRGRIKKRRT